MTLLMWLLFALCSFTFEYRLSKPLPTIYCPTHPFDATIVSLYKFTFHIMKQGVFDGIKST